MSESNIPLLRRFGLDNTTLIGIEETEDNENDDFTGVGTPALPAKKRKRRAVGRVAKGEDFWSKVDAFFKAEVDIRGRSLVGNGWKDYVNDCIRCDNACFIGGSEFNSSLTSDSTASGSPNMFSTPCASAQPAAQGAAFLGLV